MGKLILQMQTSIDNFVASASGDVSWMLWPWDPNTWPWDEKLRAYHENLTAEAQTILLSSHMAHDGFIDHWTSIASDPQNPESAFAAHITNARKVIFTRSPDGKQTDWPNTTIATTPLVQAITTIKHDTPDTILAFGGVGFAQSLVQENLVDEYHFIINPVVLHDGLSIFTQKTNLRLIGAASYESSIIVARYE